MWAWLELQPMGRHYLCVWSAKAWSFLFMWWKLIFFFSFFLGVKKHDTAQQCFKSTVSRQTRPVWFSTAWPFSIGKSPDVKTVKGLLLPTGANSSSLVPGRRDDASPSLRCFANNKHHARGSPVAHIVVARPEKDATSPHSLVFVPPAIFLFPINFHRHRSQSCQSLSGCSLPHSPPVKLPGGFPVTGWQGGAAVGPACLCEMFIWSGALTGLTAHPHRAFVMWFKPPCGLSQAPLYSPIQMKAWDWLSFFWSFCMQLQKQRRPAPPPLSETDFLNRLGRLTLVASTFVMPVASCCSVFLLFPS